MMGMGRFGGIAGSFLVAELSRRNLNFSQIFMIVAISGLVAATALVVKQLAHPETKSDYGVARGEVLGH
jgi:AAHS family 4-hydroxybenzoate transporter-like MFS transporter